MWMVGYNDGGEFNMPADSFHGRKLRPLIPRQMSSSNSASPTTTANPSLNIFHGTDFFSHYHNLSVTEQSKMRDQLNSQPVVVSSSRWNPTPEQLRALEELYHRGTRTPSAEQIQHITAQLRRFGKIEGKNVFYWFQNHKARERQKRRRQMESSADQGNHQDSVDNITEKKDLTGGVNRTMFEEQNKNINWAPSTNCSSTTLEQESFSTQRTAKAAVAECRTDGWIQFDEGELQQRRNFAERNATWQMMQLSCPPPPLPPVPANHHFINTLTAAAAAASSSCSSPTLTTATVTAARSMDPKLIKAHHDLSFFKAPYGDNIGVIRLNCFHDIIDQDNCVESQTLQLFPLRSEETDEDKESSEPSVSAALMNANFNGSTPSQFYEFLPLKN